MQTQSITARNVHIAVPAPALAAAAVISFAAATVIPRCASCVISHGSLLILHFVVCMGVSIHIDSQQPSAWLTVAPSVVDDHSSPRSADPST